MLRYSYVPYSPFLCFYPSAYIAVLLLARERGKDLTQSGRP